MRISYIERSIWFFIVGALLGTLFCSYLFLQKNGYENIAISTKENDVQVPKYLVPYYSFMNQSLNYLLENYVNKNELDYKDLFFGAVEGLYKAVGDPYTNFLSPEYFSDFSEDIDGEIGGVGLYLKNQNNVIKIISIIPQSPSYKANVKINDQILAIDGKNIADLDIDTVTDMIQGKVGTSITLTLFRPKAQQSYNVTLKRQSIVVNSVRSQIISTPQKIGYLKIEKFTNYTPQETKKALLSFEKAHLSGLVIDLRDNPGGSLQASIDIANFFISKGLIIETKGPNPDDNEQFFADPKNMIFASQTPIVILVNEESASAAEILAGTLKDHKRALLVGQKTFGKGAIQSIFPFQFNTEEIGYKITVANYYTPGGYVIDHRGINPNFSVKLPELTPALQGQVDSLIHKQILNQILKDKLHNPLSDADYNTLKKELSLRGYNIPDIFLKKIIQEQRDLANGVLDSIALPYDTQLQKAIQLLKG